MVVSPVEREITLITSNYGARIRNRREEYHRGVDLRTAEKFSSQEYYKKDRLQKIVATEDCIILEKGIDKLGNSYLKVQPLISHWLTEIVYVHVNLCDLQFIGYPGRRLSAGTPLGYSELGGNSTGHHLHFAVKNWRGYANPIHDYFIPNKIKYKFR